MKRASAASIGHGRAGRRSERGRGRSPAHSRIHLFVRRSLAQNGCCVYLIMPTSNTACFQAFLQALARKYPAGSRRRSQPSLRRSGGSANITLLYLPPYSPELNPKENLWDEIREKIFKNYALKSIRAVRAKLKQAILYIERNPKLVQSIMFLHVNHLM